MTSILIHQPHPLDAIWEHAYADEEEAARVHDEALKSGDDDLATQPLERWFKAAHAILALPARNMDDCLEKMRVSGMAEGCVLAGADPDAIFKEAVAVMDEALQRGKAYDISEKQEARS